MDRGRDAQRSTVSNTDGSLLLVPLLGVRLRGWCLRRQLARLAWSTSRFTARTARGLCQQETLWGSLLLANGKIYVTNLEGTTYVLAAGPKFQLLSTNEIPEPAYAALAVSNGDLFLRTHEHLYCIRQAK